MVSRATPPRSWRVLWLEHRARLPANEGRAGPESFRGPLVAWIAPPRLPGDVGLRLLGFGATAWEGGPGPAGEKKGFNRPGSRSQRSAAPCSNYCGRWRGPIVSTVTRFAVRSINAFKS